MANIITIEKINEIKFYQMPKAFFHNPLYFEMKNESKIAYSILRDLLSLSIENNWVNDNNEVYVKLSREKMMKRLNIKGSAKYAEIIKELEQKELIVKRRIGLKQVDETYICLPEELSVIYSDKELLELENTDNSLKFENQTSRSLKIKPQEVSKSNVKKFENQTHTNTNFTNTNSIKTNTSSSKGNATNSINPLVELFNGSICDLKKSTTTKFMKYVETYDKDFIEAIISYCEEKNAKSFSYFKTTIESYIAKGITTVADMEVAISQFKDENRKKKNNAIKEKDIVREENKFNSYLDDRAIYEMIENIDIEIDTANAENIDSIKEVIKNIMISSNSELQFNTYIASTNLLKLDKDIIVKCPNEFTMQIISKRYESVIDQGLEISKIDFDRIKYQIHKA